MITGVPKGMERRKCRNCGHANLVPESKCTELPTTPGSYSFAIKATPKCARCLKLLS